MYLENTSCHLVKEEMLYIPYVEYDTPPFTVTFNLVSYDAISYKEYLSIFHLHDVLCCVAPVQRKKKNKDLGKSLTSDKKLINIHF